ncbi:aminoglycoside adenylyltransferase domain-containing protein [Bacillus suaedaesalsae]|uniref:Spectinomycin 9-adenylyltransferase n=1 Tax=Bacillus suaedaesalsae TaxID=2810349 RepID=A0ABS2DGE6_9BACI|nr:aminoglycoside adenylyltransferase domain-containing protein [Bacillus suaedaesalsae]MBM6617552.1 DUF4111 domain-containing protein [Bacillus suaedaesalsae]
MNTRFKTLLEKLVVTHKAVLNDKLLGIYLHGSIAFGCATSMSDVDYLVVVKEKLTKSVKEAMMNLLVELSAEAPRKGLEMSIVTKDAVNPFIYPTPFELHASSSYIETYKYNGEMCENLVDYDLAAHISVLLEKGICLYGSPINSVFSGVPVEHFKDSILRDIQDATIHYKNEPVYYLLNLSRVWMFLAEGKLVSKLEGGEWATDKLASPYTEVVWDAVHSYHNGVNFTITEEVKDTLDFLVSIIEQYKSSNIDEE